MRIYPILIVSAFSYAYAQPVYTPGRVRLEKVEAYLPETLELAHHDVAAGADTERVVPLQRYMTRYALGVCFGRVPLGPNQVVNGTFAIAIRFAKEGGANLDTIRLLQGETGVEVESGTVGATEATPYGIDTAMLNTVSDGPVVRVHWGDGDVGTKCVKWARESWSSASAATAGTIGPVPAEQATLMFELYNEAGALYADYYADFAAHSNWMEGAVRNVSIVRMENQVPQVRILPYTELVDLFGGQTIASYLAIRFAQDSPGAVFAARRACVPGARPSGQDTDLLSGTFSYQLAHVPVGNFSAIPSSRVKHHIATYSALSGTPVNTVLSLPTTVGLDVPMEWQGSECGTNATYIIAYRMFSDCNTAPETCGGTTGGVYTILADAGVSAVTSRFRLQSGDGYPVTEVNPINTFDVRVDDKPSQGESGSTDAATTVVDLSAAFGPPGLDDGHVEFDVGVRGYSSVSARKMLRIVSISDECYNPVEGSAFRFDSAQLHSFCSNVPPDFETASQWLNVDTSAMSTQAASNALLAAWHAKGYPLPSVYDINAPAVSWESAMYPVNTNSTIGLNLNRGSSNASTVFPDAEHGEDPSAYYTVRATMEQLLACRKQGSTVPAVTSHNGETSITYTVPIAVTTLAFDPVSETGAWTRLACMRSSYRVSSANSYTTAARMQTNDAEIEVELRRVEVQLGTDAQCTVGGTTDPLSVAGAGPMDRMHPVAMPRPYSYGCTNTGGAVARLRITLLLRINAQRSPAGGDAGVLPPMFLPRREEPAETYWPASLRPVEDVVCYGMNMSTVDASMSTEFVGTQTFGGVQFNLFSLTYSTGYMPFSGDGSVTAMEDVFTSCSSPGKSHSRFDVVVPFKRYAAANGQWASGIATGNPAAFIDFEDVRVAVEFVARFDPREFMGMQTLVNDVQYQMYRQHTGAPAGFIERAIPVDGVIRLTRGDRIGMAFATTSPDTRGVADMFIEDVHVALLSDATKYHGCVVNGTGPNCGAEGTMANMVNVCDKEKWQTTLSMYDTPSVNPISKSYRFMTNFEPVSALPWQQEISPRPGVNTTTASCRYEVNADKAYVGTPRYFCGQAGAGASRCGRDTVGIVNPFGNMQDGGEFGYDAFTSPGAAERSQDAYLLSTWGVETGKQIVICTRVFWYMCRNTGEVITGRRLLATDVVGSVDTTKYAAHAQTDDSHSASRKLLQAGVGTSVGVAATATAAMTTQMDVEEEVPEPPAAKSDVAAILGGIGGGVAGVCLLSSIVMLVARKQRRTRGRYDDIGRRGRAGIECQPRGRYDDLL